MIIMIIIIIIIAVVSIAPYHHRQGEHTALYVTAKMYALKNPK